jgi:hypothetical protein
MPDPLNTDFTSTGMHKFAFTQETSAVQPWLLSRLWKKQEDSAKLLTLKAHSIKPEAEEMHKELMKMLDSFSSSESLYPYVREVIDPLLREIDHILIKMQNNITQDALHKYSRWTEKARRLVHLCNLVDDEEKLKQAVNDHIVGRSLELIDRDVKLIVEYHASQNPFVDITSFIKELHKLKINPELPLEKISAWKHEFDLKRQAIVNDAYQAIDQ